MLPFQLSLTPELFRNHPGARPISRHLSALGDIFAHPAAGDPLIYEFVDLRDGLTGSMLSFGLTIIQPGTIAGEYYMTKGHFHAAQQDGDEVYLGVSGNGRLLMQSRQGESRELELSPGAILYTPLAWAHRTVNVGCEPLVFFSIWPSATAYDYEEITRRGGFPVRVMDQIGRPTLVPNPAFHI